MLTADHVLILCSALLTVISTVCWLCCCAMFSLHGELGFPVPTHFSTTPPTCSVIHFEIHAAGFVEDVCVGCVPIILHSVWEYTYANGLECGIVSSQPFSI